MNTQPCQDCSVIVMCISRGEYPHYVAMCKKCKGLYPVTSLTKPRTTAEPRLRGTDYYLIDIGPQVHIPMSCPKHTLDFKQLRAEAASVFKCRVCLGTEALEDRHRRSTNSPLGAL